MTRRNFYKIPSCRKKQATGDHAQTIPPNQAWFWTEHWQQMEREAQAEIKSGDVLSFDNVQDALKYLSDTAKTNA